MGVVDNKKYKYERIKLRGPNNEVAYSASSADAVARALFRLSKEDLVKVLQANGMDHVVHHADTMNPGHFQMVVGQSLRAILNKGSPVVIGPHTVSSLDQADVPWPAGWIVVPVARRGTPTPPASITFKK